MSNSTVTPHLSSPRSPPTTLQAIRAVAGSVLRQHLASGMTTVFQAAFLVTLALAIFLVGRVYHSDVTSLDMQWLFFPWIASVLVPALATQTLVDTPGDRRLELYASLPFTSASLAVGTWLAGMVVLLATLALTSPFPATMAYLGDLDRGTALAGYIGAAGFLAVSYAVALLAAAVTRDVVGGFTAGVVALLVLQLFATDAAVAFLSGTNAEALIDVIPWISPGHWLGELATGRISLASVIALVGATTLALAATAVLIERRRSTGSSSRCADLARAIPIAVGALAGLALVVSFAARINAGADLTDEGEFTLHAQTLAVVAAAKPATHIHFYWSQSNADVPASIRQHAQRIRRLLQEIADLSGGRITLRQHDPAPDTEAEDTARLQGMQQVALSAGGHFMLGATFSQGDRRAAMAYFAPERAAVLEYDVVATLAALGRTNTPRVGILSPLLAPRHVSEPREGLTILEDIKRQYDVAIIPHFADALPEGLDALVVIDASILKPEMLRAIDAHVMAGRGLIVMVDPFARFNTASNAVTPEPSEEINDISDLLLRYGLRYDSASVVGDSTLASTVGAGDQRFTYPFWLRVRRPHLSDTDPAIAGLNEMAFAEAGNFTANGKSNVRALVTTSDRAGVLPRGAFKDGAPQQLATQLTSEGGERIVAATIKGPVASAFAARAQGGTSAGSNTASTARIFAIADVDWIFDPLTYTNVASEGRNLSRPLNDNTTALSNMIEAAVGLADLSGIRSRGRLSRPFTRVADMLTIARDRYRKKEAELVGRISGVEDNMRKVLELSGATTLDQLPQELQGQVRDLRTALLPYRRELRSLRQAMREEIERLGRLLTLANLLAGPILALILALVARFWRQRSIVQLAA